MATYSNCKKLAEEIEEKVYLNIMAVLCVKNLIDLVFVYFCCHSLHTVTCLIKLKCADKGKIIHCTKFKEFLYLYYLLNAIPKAERCK